MKITTVQRKSIFNWLLSVSVSIAFLFGLVMPGSPARAANLQVNQAKNNEVLTYWEFVGEVGR